MPGVIEICVYGRVDARTTEVDIYPAEAGPIILTDTAEDGPLVVEAMIDPGHDGLRHLHAEI
jgi:hypothetical protein